MYSLVCNNEHIARTSSLGARRAELWTSAKLGGWQNYNDKKPFGLYATTLKKSSGLLVPLILEHNNKTFLFSLYETLGSQP